MPPSSIDCSFLQSLLAQDAAPAHAALHQAPKQAHFQGRTVEQELSQAHKITLSPELQAGVVTAASSQRAQQCQEQPRPPTPKPPELVRQARYPALPSHGQLLGLPKTQANAPRLQPLASCAELIASAGHAKSYTLLERFLNLIFRRDKSSRRYNSILKSLQVYHDACINGNCKKAQIQLQKLARLVDRHLQASDITPERTQIIQEFRQQISDELTAFTSLAAEWETTQRPKEVTIPHALAFAREGVCLAQMLDLHKQGLQLDHVKVAREIVQSQKQSTASAQSLPEGYLVILATLQKYHSALEQGRSNTDRDVARQAGILLNELDNITSRYIRYRDDAQIKPFRELYDRIQIERQVLQQLLIELNYGHLLPEQANLSEALAFAREGVSLKAMAHLMAKGLKPSQASDARILLDSERINYLIGKKEQTSLFKDYEISLLEFSGLGTNAGHTYRELGLPITRKTVVTEFANAQRLGHISTLGKGALNTVHTAHYLQADGSLIEGVFKPLGNAENGWVAEKTGINKKLPQTANRNLATQAVARALGFDVVVNCKIGTLALGSRVPQIGLVMDKAQGKQAYHTDAEHFKKPVVQREITKLQLLDHLVGQGDRHSGNYFIHIQEDENGQTTTKVSGIDNDQCFGKNIEDGNGIRFENNADRIGFRGTAMPELIDTDMAAAIFNLTQDKLQDLLSDTLAADEVSAACARLGSLQQHVQSLQAKHQVITPDHWNTLADKAAYHNATNSYFARDMVKFKWPLPSQLINAI